MKPIKNGRHKPQKYDGTEDGPLSDFEIRQIAGRGRHGLHGKSEAGFYDPDGGMDRGLSGVIAKALATTLTPPAVVRLQVMPPSRAVEAMANAFLKKMRS